MKKNVESFIYFFVMQGCENDIDSLMEESVSQVLDSLFLLCKHTGELALATHVPMITLQDTRGMSVSSDDDIQEEEPDRVMVR